MPNPSTPQNQGRQRSPIKRMVDKMFRRSPDKKKIGQASVDLIDPVKPIQNPPNVNIGNYKINSDYIQNKDKRNSPTAQSMPFLGQKVFGEVNKQSSHVNVGNPALQTPQVPKVKSQIVDIGIKDPIEAEMDEA